MAKKIVIELSPEEEARLLKSVDAILRRLRAAEDSTDGSVRRWASTHIPVIAEISMLFGGKG